MANIIAIVGRSNVGKSTLFNRLVESKQAIMDNTVGTTRDRNYGSGQWCNKQFTVIDTGGYFEGDQDPFQEEICEQIQLALSEAHLILFMVDCKDGLTPLDYSFAKLLRKVGRPIFVVANKADHIQSQMVAPTFYALGFGTPFPIAAINGSGTGELLDGIIPHLLSSTEDDLPDDWPKFVILGRPNVGKSSFLNVLVGQKRSMVSPVAGTTRDAIHTEYNLYGQQLILTDTAGIRKKAKVTGFIEFYAVLRAIRAMQHADVCLLMIDAVQGLQAQDVSLLDLAHRYKKGMVLLVNKWDLINKQEINTVGYTQQLHKKLAPLHHLPIVYISSLTKQWIYQALQKGMEIYNNRQIKISTSTLNKVLLPIIEAKQPPALRGKHIKIKYCVQIRSAPPLFAFFCNHPGDIAVNYKSFLENTLRKHFNLLGVPIQLVFKKK